MSPATSPNATYTDHFVRLNLSIVLVLVLVLFTLTVCTATTLPLAEAWGAEKTVVISSAFPGEMIKAGDTATFPLTITNMGATSIDGRIRYSPFGEAEEWDIRFEAGGRNIHRISIPPGGREMVTLIAETTGDAAVGEHRIRVNFRDARITLFVMITETRADEPGTLELTVVNKEGDKVRGATVSAYIDIDGKLADQMMTTAGGVISMDLAEGTYDIMVEKVGYEIRWERDVRIRVGRERDLGIISLEREPFAAEIRVGTPSKTITAGTRPVFEITVENLGEFDDTYKLRVDGLPHGWHARYLIPDVGMEVTEVFIRFGEQKNLNLEVIPPHDVEIGEYKFTSEIESSVTLYSDELSLDIRGIVGKRVDFDRYRVEITAGDAASFVVTVRNYGRGVTLTNIRPNVSAPGGWRVDITPRTATSILPGERRVFNVDVIPPGDIVAGEYRLDLVVGSDQAEDEEVEFRVVVEEGVHVAVFGIMILCIVVVGLWFMFKKFGRR